MLLAEGLRFADRERFDYRYAYFLPWKDAMVEPLRAQGADVTCFGGRTNARILLSAGRVADYLRQHRIDVLHCHLPVAGAVGRVAGRMAGVPVVYTEHNKQERYHTLTRYLNRATWPMQSRAVAVSADVAESIRTHIGSRVPVDVVLNGVDVDRFRRDEAQAAALRSQLDIPQDAPVIGTVAVFRTQKRLKDWVEAARQIRERVPEARFLLVGDGPLRGEVEAAITAREMGDAIVLPGLIEEVRPYLAAMDLYMMSSIFEGLPVALLEAMSMECAPVCTSVGGIPEAIEEGRNGILTPPGEPGALAETVCALIADPDRLRRIASSARASVVENFSMRRMAHDLERIYLEIGGNGRNGHGNGR